MSEHLNADAIAADLDRVIAERDKAREECGYEKRMREAQRKELDQFVRLKREREAERDALAATVQRVRGLADEWEHGEYSATEVEPGIAYCAGLLRAALDGTGEEAT